MSYKIVWTRPALGDLARVIDFLKDKNPDAARRAALRINEMANHLVTQPFLGKAMEDNTGRRELSAPFGKRAYILRYMLDEDNKTAVILRVWHSLEIQE